MGRVFQSLLIGLIWCFGAALLLGAELTDPVPGAGWKPLFNGKDFSGLTTYLEKVGVDTDPTNIFQVEDGAIHLYKDHKEATKVSRGYFATKGEYSHYRLRFQYKFGGKKFLPRTERPRDAGVMFHASAADQMWPRSVECQVQEGDTGDCFSVGGVRLTTSIEPGKSTKGCAVYKPVSEGGIEQVVGSAKDMRFVKHGTHENEGWNTVEVIAHGDKEIVHIVNGQEVFRGKNLEQLRSGKNDWVPLSSGRIVFQAEYAEVYYRKIEIKELPKSP